MLGGLNSGNQGITYTVYFYQLLKLSLYVKETVPFQAQVIQWLGLGRDNTENLQWETKLVE